MAETRSPGQSASVPVPHRLRGRVLLAASWIMRLVGGLTAGIAMAQSESAYTTAHDPGYNGPPWTVLVLLSIVVILLGALLLGAGLKVGRYARRHLVRVITSAAELAPCSYVLYLRPFDQDRPASGIDPGTHVTPAEQILRSGRTYEERLARMFRRFGPMVTIGRPGEDLPAGSGACRFYLTGGDWHDPVRELIRSARVILLGAGPGKGTVWEFTEVLRHGDAERLVILVSDPRWYEQFRTLSDVEVTSVLPDLRRRYGAAWQPLVLPGLPPPENPKRRDRAYFRAMIYVSRSRDWRVSMVTFSTSAVNSRRARRDKLGPLLAHLRAAEIVTPAPPPARQSAE